MVTVQTNSIALYHPVTLSPFCPVIVSPPRTIPDFHAYS